MCRHIRRDTIKNEVIWDKVGMTSMVDEIGEAKLRGSDMRGRGTRMHL